MENKKEAAKLTCEYKDPNTFVMTCESKESEQEVTEPEQIIEEVDDEEIEVPVVGDVNETEASYVEPLGESSSWYPDTVDYENVVNYSYGNSSGFVASLTNPEVGFEASDIILIGIIALSCLAVVVSTALITSKAIIGRATRKNFIKK